MAAAYFCVLNSKNMESTLGFSVESQQVRLIQQILGITDPQFLFQIADFVSLENRRTGEAEFSEDEVSEAEIAFVRERLALARSKPESLIPLATAIQNIKNRRT